MQQCKLLVRDKIINYMFCLFVLSWRKDTTVNTQATMVGYNKMELQDVGYRGMNWKDPAQDTHRWRALVIRVINCRVT